MCAWGRGPLAARPLRLVPPGCPSDSLPHRRLTAAVGACHCPGPRAARRGREHGLWDGHRWSAGACWGGSFTLDNVNTSDDAWATCAGGTNNGRISNFYFSVPPSATITGIEVEVEGNDGLGGAVDYAVQLSWDNSVSWTALQAGTFAGATDATTVLGGPANNWGHTWAVAELAVFQLRIRRTAGGNLRVDRIRVNVHYTLASSTHLYRSVGTNPANLNTSFRTVQVAGSTATFSGSMPANVGVGDVLQYQVAATWYLAFISGRTSDTVYTVQSSAGGTPQAAAVGTRSVSTAPTPRSPTGRDPERERLSERPRRGLRHSKDLTTSNVVMNVACYADGADTAVTVSGWTTAATNYIRIYTPVLLAGGGDEPAPSRAVGHQQVPAGSSRRRPLDRGLLRPRRRPPGSADRGRGQRQQRSPSPEVQARGCLGYEVSGNIVRGNGVGSQDIRIGINLYERGIGSPEGLEQRRLRFCGRFELGRWHHPRRPGLHSLRLRQHDR